MNNESIQQSCLFHNFDFYENNVNEIRRQIVPSELLRFIHIVKECELYSVIVYADTGKYNTLSPLTSFSCSTIEQLPSMLFQALSVLHSSIKNLNYHGVMVSEHIKYTEKDGIPVIDCSMMVTVDGKAKHLSAVRSLSRKPFTDALNEIVSIRDKLMEEYNITPLESLSIQDKTYLLQSLRNIINN
jgi:hypothetical protein